MAFGNVGRILLIVFFVGLAPMAFFSIATGQSFLESRREAVETELQATVTALASAIDRELAAEIRVLEVLASSAELYRGDLAAFYRIARRAVETAPSLRGAIALVDVADGSMPMITVRPLGEALPKTTLPEFHRRIAETRKPVIHGIVSSGAIVREPFIVIGVPVFVGETVRYSVSVTIRPEALNAILREQGFPENWVAAVVDPFQRIAARSSAAEKFVGNAATPSLVEAILRDDKGFFTATTQEGQDVYTHFRGLGAPGWTVVMGVPAAYVEGPLSKSSLRLMIAGLAVGAASIAAGLILIRTILARRSREEDERQQALIAAAQAAEAARDAAESADRTKTEFMSCMSHELRTPLNAIIGFSELMKEAGHGISDEYRGYVSHIHAAGSHLLTLVSDVLCLSAIQAGRLDVSMSTVSVGKAAATAMGLLKVQAEENGIGLVNTLAPDGPLVRANLSRLTQIIVNLLANAIKFSDRGGQVRISAIVMEENVTLFVEDQGIGMDEADISRALEPFVQVGRSDARLNDGLGLGLSLAMRLVELQEGTMRIRSRRGEGTIVSVRLAAARADDADEAPICSLRPDDGAEGAPA